jgi:hypothetical protein
MFSAIRKRLHLSPATVIASLALVFAMAGGAYAAGKYVITSTKQISPKVLKSLTGKAGPAGKAGANGIAGAAGAQGTAGGRGEKGEKGDSGAAGTSGSDGQSVTSKTLGPEEGGCEEGGVELSSASGKSSVCDGLKGAKGAPGEPWTPNNQLPKGATETGSWIAPANSSMEEFGTISFTVQLAGSLDGSHVQYVTLAEKTSTHCPGEVEKPAAESGFLCVYEGPLSEPVGSALGANIFKPGSLSSGAGPAGAVIGTESESANARFVGTWAVKAA